MSQSLQRAGAFLSLVAAVGLLGTSCVANESSIFIRGCVVPTDNGLKGCSFTSDSSAKTWPSGVLDPAQADYHCALLIGNQLVARGDTKQVRTETSRVEIHTAVVTVYDSTKGSVYATFSVPSTGFIDPGTASQPGFGIADAEILDRVTARKHVGETLVAGVIIQGRTLGGLEVESAEWTYPIQVTGAGALCNLGPCYPGAKTTDMPVLTCHGGADAPTDCRQGCVCLLRDSDGKPTGDCAPLGCQADKTGQGVCGACRSSADCAAPATCSMGLCQ